MPYLCLIVGFAGGFVAIIGVVAGIKRQRTLLAFYAAALLVVVLLDAATSYFSTELRMDIVQNRGAVKDVGGVAQASFKR